MSKGSFRHSAGFGKRIEYSIIAQMLKEGLDVYVPLVDDNGIDAVVRKPDGTFVEVQIKARSANVNPGDEALFAGIKHEHRTNYWFVFYAEGVRRTIDDSDVHPLTFCARLKACGLKVAMVARHRVPGKRDRFILEGFLKSRYKTMPRTMLRYAIEKFPERLRQKYLKGKVRG